MQENQSIANAPPAEIMAERIDCIIAHDQLDRLSQITSPVLVAVARDDIVTPPYYSHQLREAIPGAELKISMKEVISYISRNRLNSMSPSWNSSIAMTNRFFHFLQIKHQDEVTV